MWMFCCYAHCCISTSDSLARAQVCRLKGGQDVIVRLKLCHEFEEYVSLLKYLQILSERYSVAAKEMGRSIQPCNWRWSKILPVAYRGRNAICDMKENL